MPTGRVLVVDIYSNWGDSYYIGLNGIDIFDGKGCLISASNSVTEQSHRDANEHEEKEKASSRRIEGITADPIGMRVLPEASNDPRVVANLLNGFNFTKNDLHVWMAPIIAKPTLRLV